LLPLVCLTKNFLDGFRHVAAFMSTLQFKQIFLVTGISCKQIKQ
jgi:hypothetical protein